MWQLNFRFLFPKLESGILTGCGGTTENLDHRIFLQGVILTNVMFLLPLVTSCWVKRSQFMSGCKTEYTSLALDLMIVVGSFQLGLFYDSLIPELCSSKHHSLHQMLQWNSWKMFVILADIVSFTSVLKQLSQFQYNLVRITKKQNKNTYTESKAKGKFQPKQLV